MAVDEVGIDRPQRLVVETQLAGGGHPQVVVHHVGPRHQGLEGGTGGRRLEVERHATLAPLAGGEDPLHVAHLVARGRLHLDHVGSEVGQQHGAEGPGEEVPQIEDAQALRGASAP